MHDLRGKVQQELQSRQPVVTSLLDFRRQKTKQKETAHKHLLAGKIHAKYNVFSFSENTRSACD